MLNALLDESTGATLVVVCDQGVALAASFDQDPWLAAHQAVVEARKVLALRAHCWQRYGQRAGAFFDSTLVDAIIGGSDE